jgi:hypothetical protein
MHSSPGLWHTTAAKQLRRGTGLVCIPIGNPMDTKPLSLAEAAKKIKLRFLVKIDCIIAYQMTKKISLESGELWSHIYSFQKANLPCFVGYTALGELVGLGRRQTIYLIKEMIDLGLLERSYGVDPHGRKRRYLTAKIPPDWTDIAWENRKGTSGATHCTPPSGATGRAVPSGATHCTQITPNKNSIEESRPADGENGTPCLEKPSAFGNTNGNGKHLPPNGKKKPLDPKWKEMANQLATAIGQVLHRDDTSHLTTWAKELSLLRYKNGIETATIRKVLTWYCERFPIHWRTEFFRQAQSGAAFRKKFGEIEMDMKRHKFRLEDEDPPDSVDPEEEEDDDIIGWIDATMTPIRRGTPQAKVYLQAQEDEKRKKKPLKEVEEPTKFETDDERRAYFDKIFQ